MNLDEIGPWSEIKLMNRNCKQEDVSKILPGELEAMDRFWGDRSWHAAMFRPSAQQNLFGDEDSASIRLMRAQLHIDIEQPVKEPKDAGLLVDKSTSVSAQVEQDGIAEPGESPLITSSLGRRGLAR